MLVMQVQVQPATALLSDCLPLFHCLINNILCSGQFDPKRIFFFLKSLVNLIALD